MPHDMLPAPVPAPDDQGPSPQAVGDAARVAIMDALGILEHQGTPLALLLARQAQTRPDLLLKAAARFSPTVAKQDLLPTIQAMHLAALRAIARAQPVVIDQRPDDDWLS